MAVGGRQRCIWTIDENDAKGANRVKSVLYKCWGGAKLYLVGNVEPVDPPDHVDVEKQTILRRERVLSIMSASMPAIDRCIAAAGVPRMDLCQIVSETHAINMQSAGLRINPVLHERLRTMRAPFRCLFALYGFPAEDQPQELDAWTERVMTALGGERRVKVKGVRGMNRARDQRAIASLVERVGERRVRALLNTITGSPKR